MSDQRLNKWLTRIFGQFEFTEKPGMPSYPMSRAHMHSQNLNDRGHRDDNGTYHEAPQGPMWQHGRAWWYFGRQPGSTWNNVKGGEREVTMEWSVGTKAHGIAFWIDGCPYDDGPKIQFHIAIHRVLSLFLSTTWRGWRPGRCGFSLSVSDGDFFQVFWNHRDEHMDSSRETGWRKSWFLNDVFFGNTTMHQQVIDTRPVIVHMPEGGYRGVCTLHLDTWTRPRWPGKVWQQRKRTTLDMDPGQEIPVPGKGENSWDCDDDALFGQTSPADSVEAAIAGMRASVMKARGHYASPTWVPRDGWKAAHPI